MFQFDARLRAGYSKALFDVTYLWPCLAFQAQQVTLMKRFALTS